MANDGGVIIYGIEEDENKRLTILNPIPLKGQVERIDSIVRTSIEPPPAILISAIPTSVDPEKGYVVVVILPSDSAPHMVIVKGDYRYYGRTDTGNVPLTEGEVARLYERRRWEVDRETVLTEEIARSEIAPSADLTYLYLVARPVSSNEELLQKATGKNQTIQAMLQDLINAKCH